MLLLQDKRAACLVPSVSPVSGTYLHNICKYLLNASRNRHMHTHTHIETVIVVVLFFIRYPWLWTPAPAPMVRRSGAGTWVWQPAVTTGSSPEAADASSPSLMSDVTLACHLSSWGPGSL